jgi:hypothetical protein
MAGFVVLSMVAAFFIQYSFLSVTKDNYPDHTDLAKFLGYFTGSLTLFTFLFKTFVYSRLMKTYGLKTSLLISPVLLGLLTILAVIIGSFYGYTSASASFAFFFLLISLGRLFSKALKDSVEAPSFKILYQSLPTNIRHDVQAKVDGTINEMAALLAGLLLAGFGLFSFIKLIHFSYFLVFIIGAWLFVAFWLYRRYRESLEKSLSSEETENIELGMNLFDLNKYIRDSIENEEQEKIKKILGFYSYLKPIEFENFISRLINNDDDTLRAYSIRSIGERSIYRAYDKLKDHSNNESLPEFRELTKKAMDQIDLPKDNIINDKDIKDLSKSSNPEDRIKAVRLIAKNKNDTNKIFLKHLLRDQDEDVKIETIKIIPEFKDTELAELLIDYLTHPYFYSYAFDALVECGDMVVDELEQSFHKSEKEDKDRIRIVKILEKVGNGKAINYLKNKLDQHNIDIFKSVLWALKNNNYQVEPDNFAQVQQIIEKHIGITGWNLAAKSSLMDDNFSEELLEAINEEIAENYEVLYLLMIIAYNPESVSHFKDNLESDTSEGISYALELLDLFLADELKPKLFPLFDDISLNERVRQLQLYYPIKKMDKEELLKSILNRDINNVNVWTKACALYSYTYLNDFKVTDDLIAQIFNPIQILSETASWIVQSKNSAVFQNCLERLDSNTRYQLNQAIVEAKENHYRLLINKVFALKNIHVFDEIPGYYITRFINCISMLDEKDFRELFTQKEKLRDSIFILMEGEVLILHNAAPIVQKVANELLDFNEIEDMVNVEVKFNSDHLRIIQLFKPSFYFEMFDYPKIIEQYVKIFNSLSPTKSLKNNGKG